MQFYRYSISQKMVIFLGNSYIIEIGIFVLVGLGMVVVVIVVRIEVVEESVEETMWVGGVCHPPDFLNQNVLRLVFDPVCLGHNQTMILFFL